MALMAVAALPQLGGSEGQGSSHHSRSGLSGKYRSISHRAIHGPSGVWIPSKDGETPGLANEIITYIALFTVAVGTGGIKPCVSALGGDQGGF